MASLTREMSNQSDSGLNPLLPEESVSLIVVAFVLTVLAITSNAMLIYVLIRTSALHTCTNFFIASLSAGEFLTGMFVIPFAGASAIYEGWASSSALCGLVGFVGVLGPCASALSLLAVSTDRFVAISRPLRYASLVTRKSTAIVITGLWTVSLVVSLLPLVRWGKYSYSQSFKVCLMRSSSSSAASVSEVLMKEVFTVFIPAGLIVLIVLKTVHDIRGQRRVFVFVPVPVTVTSLPAGAQGVNTSRSRGKAIRTLLLVLMVFIIFCLPVAAADILCHRHTDCRLTPRMLRTLLWVSFLSCVIHPNIIMLMNRKFRAALKTLLCRGLRGRLQQPGWGDKEPFTITSGLQAVLEASLLVNVLQTTLRHDVSVRRHVITAMKSQTAEDCLLAPVRYPQLMTLRKIHSSPDCRFVEVTTDR